MLSLSSKMKLLVCLACVIALNANILYLKRKYIRKRRYRSTVRRAAQSDPTSSISTTSAANNWQESSIKWNTENRASHSNFPQRYLKSTIAPTKSPTTTRNSSSSQSPIIEHVAQISDIPNMNTSSPPTQAPSTVTSSQPSKASTASPSMTPTFSSIPTSSILSTQPTSFQPSLRPTVSMTPTWQPSTESSKQPSLSPSSSHSLKPSVGTSAYPSLNPTLYPSREASGSPSVKLSPTPSTSTSTNPSISVNTSPSISTSTGPSLSASISPSISTSMGPSISASISPSIFQKQSLSPSVGPSVNLSTSTSVQTGNGEEENSSNDSSEVVWIGGITASVGIIGLVSLVVLLCRQKESESQMVNTLTDEESTTSFPRTSNGSLETSVSSSSTDNQVVSDAGDSDHCSDVADNQNNNLKDPCTFTYSDDESSIFRDLGIMSLSSSSLGSGKASRFSFKDLGVDRSIVSRKKLELPVQQLRPEINITPKRRNSCVSEQDLNSLSEVSLLKTEVMQQTQHNLARILSCFSSTSILNKAIAKNMSERMKYPKTGNIPHDTIDTRGGSDLISVVSSLSGRSSCTESTVDFHQGHPYEVLVPGEVDLGLVVKSTKLGPQVVHVKQSSPLHRVVEEGDHILSVDGMDTRHISAKALSKWLHKTADTNLERTIILMGSKRESTFHHVGSKMID